MIHKEPLHSLTNPLSNEKPKIKREIREEIFSKTLGLFCKNAFVLNLGPR